MSGTFNMAASTFPQPLPLPCHLVRGFSMKVQKWHFPIPRCDCFCLLILFLSHVVSRMTVLAPFSPLPPPAWSDCRDLSHMSNARLRPLASISKAAHSGIQDVEWPNVWGQNVSVYLEVGTVYLLVGSDRTSLGYQKIRSAAGWLLLNASVWVSEICLVAPFSIFLIPRPAYWALSFPAVRAMSWNVGEIYILCKWICNVN